MALTVLLTTEEKVTLRLNPATAAGNPSEIDTQDQVPQWSNETGLALEPAADGKSCVVRPGTASPGQIHEVVVSKADADRDPAEVRELPAESASIVLTLPEPATLGLTADAPEPLA